MQGHFCRHAATARAPNAETQVDPSSWVGLGFGGCQRVSIIQMVWFFSGGRIGLFHGVIGEIVGVWLVVSWGSVGIEVYD